MKIKNDGNDVKHVSLKLMICLTYADRPLVAICKGLFDAGVELFVVCDPRAEKFDVLKEYGFRLESVVVKSRLDFAAVRQYKKLIGLFDPDVIYAPANKTLSVTLLASRGKSIKIVGYRGTIGHISRLDPASWMTYLNPRLNKIFCVSHAVEDYLHNKMHIKDSKLITIYKGHDVQWYQNAEKIDLQQFSVPSDAFVVAFVGNIRPVKGVDVLLRSISQIPPESHLHFLFVGEVRDPSIKQLLNDKEVQSRTTFVGYRADALNFIKSSDVFVMPSVEREGLPRAVFEAMALRKPVVVSNVGGMKEQIVDGKCGLIVEPKDEVALVSAFLKLENEPALCSKYGNAGYKRLEEYFNIQQTISKFYDQLKLIVK